MAYRSRYPDVGIPLVPLPDFILEAASRCGEKPAIIDGLSGRTVTYRELADRARRTAAGLVARGLRKGDVLGIYSPNLPEYAIAFYGASMAGAIVTTINSLYNAAELTYQLRDAGVTWLITSPESVETARRAGTNAALTHLYAFEDVPGVTPFRALWSADVELPPVDINPAEDVVALPYSSATTGLSKGVMLTHLNLVASIAQTEPLDHMAASEIVLAVMPFYHIYGLSAVMNRSLHAGVTLVTLPRFEVKQFLDAIEKYRVTTAFLVPPIVRTLVAHPLVGSYDLSSLRYATSAAATLSESVARAFGARIGCVLTQAYGMTEASPVTHMTPRDAVKLTSVGVVVPNTEYRVVDVATKRDVPPGELGEIWVRGPQVMKGYLNSPEVTRRIVDNGRWLHTGDIGYADRDCYLYVVDRAKDLVKFRGLEYRDDELLLAAVEDLSARRQAAERLQFQALLLDSVRESILGTDRERRITFWNKGAEALFGYSAEETMGRSVNDLIVPNVSEMLNQRVQEDARLATDDRWQGQALRRRKDGSLLWTDVIVSVVKDPDGIESGLIAIHRDVTDLKNSEEMLRDSNERLQSLATRLMDVREHERAALARELHDELGQALTRLKMDLCALMDKLPKRVRTKRVETMVPLVDRMVSTVQHLSSQLRPAILDDLGLEAAIEWQTQEFEEWSGARCMLDLHLDSWTTDRERDTAIFRILQETLTNVARHANATTVTISSRLDGDQFVLQIEDDGIGIPDSEITSRRSLGLIGIRERVKGLGGHIDIWRKHGGGTAISLRVRMQPAAPSQEPPV